MINSLVQCQLSYINTIDPNFVGGTSAIAMVSWSRFVCCDLMLTAHALAHRPRMSSGARGRR